jgi:uroporphyrinogen-III synthase
MIFVTRPSPEGEILTEWLNNSNLSAKHLPLFSISAGDDLQNLQYQFNNLLPNDIVIIVSPQVIHTIKTNLPNFLFPTNINYFAIGKKTAKLLNQFTPNQVIYPAQENSEGLLALLTYESVKNRTVLILRGNVGRPLLMESLTEMQANVKLLECYQRHPITYSTDILTNNIKKQIIIITSVQHLMQVELYCKTQHKNFATLIVTSERIFEKAKQLKWKKVLQVKGANNQILFKTMITLCHNVTFNLIDF